MNPQAVWKRLRWGLASSVDQRGLAAGVAWYGINQVTRILLMRRAGYFRWKHQENEWERRDISIQDQVGGQQEWDEVAMLGLSFLKDAGLRPHHTLLDAGCGCFRIGRLLIGYLDPGGYSGFDGSEYLLTEGRRQVLAQKFDLDRKRPAIRHLFITDRVVPLFEEFLQHYDFILVHAIFDHLPPERIKLFLESLVSVMHSHTRIHATFFLNPFGDDYKAPIKRLRYGQERDAILTYSDKEYWHHTSDFFQRVCAEIGTVRFVGYHDYRYPIEGLKMAEFGAIDPVDMPS